MTMALSGEEEMHRYTQGRSPGEDRGRDGTDASPSPGLPRMVGSSPKLRETSKGFAFKHSEVVLPTP